MPEFIFNGTAGRLEGRYVRPKNAVNPPLAVLLHPHPQHGGTMNNKVVYMMHQAFLSRGFATMRFNYRGVGKSQGEWDEGVGELADAATALDWMQETHPNAPYIWVGGFSFGAWIGMQLLMRRPEIAGFVSISPPANMYDFSFLAPCPSSGLIVQGTRDTIVTEESVAGLVEKLRAQRGIGIDYRMIEGSEHFFQGHEQILMDYLCDHLDNALSQAIAAE